MKELKIADRKMVKKYLNEDYTIKESFIKELNLGFDVYTIQFKKFIASDEIILYKIVKNFKEEVIEFITKKYIEDINFDINKSGYTLVDDEEDFIKLLDNIDYNDNDVIILPQRISDTISLLKQIDYSIDDYKPQANTNKINEIINEDFICNIRHYYYSKYSDDVCDIMYLPIYNLKTKKFVSGDLKIERDNFTIYCLYDECMRLIIQDKNDNMLVSILNLDRNVFSNDLNVIYANAWYNRIKLNEHPIMNSYKNDVNALNDLAEIMNEDLLYAMYKNRNQIMISNKNEKRLINKVELLDVNNVIIKLSDIRNNNGEIIIPQKGKMQYYLLGNKVNKSTFINRMDTIPAIFELDEEVKNAKNKIANYSYFLENMIDFDALYANIDKRGNTRNNRFGEIFAKDLINLLDSQRFEEFLSLYIKVPALKELDKFSNEVKASYLNEMFDLYDKRMNKSKSNAKFVNIVPRTNLLFNIKSLNALTGLRLIDKYDTGTGIFNSLSDYSNEQLEEVGKQFCKLAMFLDSINTHNWSGYSQKLDEMLEYNKNNFNYFIENLAFTNYNELLMVMDIGGKYNKTIKELNEVIEVLEYMFGLNLNSKLLISNVMRYTLHDKSYYIDTITMYRELNPNNSFKDLLKLIKHYENNGRNVIDLHDDLMIKFKAIKDEVTQKHFEEKVNSSPIKEYKNDEFSIIKPKTFQDLLDEGNSLSHCVGTYINRVINGITFICFLRKNDNLNKSYMTIEIRDGKITQVQGSPSNKYLVADSNETEAIKEFAKLNKLQFNASSCIRY